MATTTNFGWETPDDTDLVKDGAAAIRTALGGVDTSFVDLKGGTSGQILSKASNTDLDFTWITNDVGDITAVTAGTGITGGGTSGAVTITNDMATTITTNGDLIYGTGSGTYTRRGIGTTGQVLTVTGGVPTWETPAAGSTLVGCAVYKVTTAQSISNDTDTDITFNAEDFDTNGFHDNSTNNARITIPSGKAGKYILQTSITFASNSSGTRNVAFRKNGTTVLGSMLMPALSGFAQRVQHFYIADLSVGDYVTVEVNQNSGGSLNVLADQVYTRFAAIYLGA
jgi:hypothetical protein